MLNDQTAKSFLGAVVFWMLTLPGGLSAVDFSNRVTLIRDGKPVMTIISGSAGEPVDELRAYLKKISGAELIVTSARRGATGVYVGKQSDFPWLRNVPADGVPLGAEGFLIRSDGTNLFLLGETSSGVSHAVVSFLDGLGCRWFFPGDAWEIIPRQATISGAWEQVSRPSFPTQRKIWYGFGTFKPCETDFKEWARHNQLGGTVNVSIGHTWHGLYPEKDFAAHPEWFAQVAGQRKPTKPCYSHPEILQRAIASASARARNGEMMITMSPPDGLGFCECEKCFAVFQGAKPEARQGTWFARRPDGVVVSAASETLFGFINQVAKAIAEHHPDVLVGAYAYSAYSHPPSFRLHTNVFLQTTTAFRRTDLSLEQQLDIFKERVSQVGIRDYYSVYQWDWDYPSAGKLEPARLQKELRFFHEKGVTSLNAEASNNWGARGLGYYLAARMLWDVNADIPALLRDFYQRAFGPAAEIMERHYVRWYGPSAAVLKRSAAGTAGSKADSAPDVRDEDASAPQTGLNMPALKASFQDLDTAAQLVRTRPAELARVNQLRAYLHYLVLRAQLDRATRAGDPEAILDAIQAETVFGGRLAHSNIIHVRPLLGKAFLRRFKAHEKLLANLPDAAKEDVGWRKTGEAPTDAELERLWEEDKQFLGL